MPCYQSNNAPSGYGKIGTGGYATEAECLQACKEGACCNGTTCTVKPQCQCNAAAGECFKGVGTTCEPNPCTGTEDTNTVAPFVTATIRAIPRAGSVGLASLAQGTFMLSPVFSDCGLLRYEYRTENIVTLTAQDTGKTMQVDLGVIFLVEPIATPPVWLFVVEGPNSLVENGSSTSTSPIDGVNYYINNAAFCLGRTGSNLQIGAFDPRVPFSFNQTTGTIFGLCGGYPGYAVEFSITSTNPLP